MMYYLVSLERSVSGGCLCFWRPNNRGYTYNLDEAYLFSEKEASDAVFLSKGSEIAYTEEAMKARSWRHVRVLIDEPFEAEEQIKFFRDTTRCYACLTNKNPDDSPVTWKCCQCGNTICMNHTLTIPDSEPTEYYHDTLCSTVCWEKAGCPKE